MPKSQALLAIVVAVILCGGSFYAGTKYAASSAPSRQGFGGNGGNFMRGAGGAGGMGGGAAGGAFRRGEGATMGDISKIDGSMITVKTPDGGSKLVITSSSTKVMQMSEAPLDILKADTPVTIMGTANSDGSVTAASIQVRPARPATPPPAQK